MVTNKATLLALPTEILALLPQHLTNIKDFKELSSTCRRLRETCFLTSPNTILRLAAASSRIFFRPDPYFLVAATAKQIGDWAIPNEQNTARLRSALMDGIDGLLALCVEEAGLTMDDIRRLHASRFTTFNPVIDLIDRCAGEQSYGVEDFRNGGRSDAETIDCDPERALFEMAIYGSLFQSTLEANHDHRKGLELDIRLDFIKYCIPDSKCRNYRGFTVEMMGPYKPGVGHANPRIDQYSIRHILKSSKWKVAWEDVRKAIGPDFDDERRQRIWASAVQMKGLEVFDMLRPDWAERWSARLRELRQLIERIDVSSMQATEQDLHGVIDWMAFPIMEDDIQCCVRGRWWLSKLRIFSPIYCRFG
ncbi:MAG: hypothetical protein Q9209_006846 [Squamulea sp. 1 TL-2023]